MEKNAYNFRLVFRGNLMQNSVDAYDLAATIMAVSQTLSEVSTIKYGEGSKNIKINVNAFKEGSFLSEFYIYLDPNVAGALFPMLQDSYSVGKELLGLLKTTLDVKAKLKGLPPSKVVPQPNNTFNIYGNDGTLVVNVDSDGFKIIQDKSIGKNISKIPTAIMKESSEIEEIDLSAEDQEDFVIDKVNGGYLSVGENFQNIPNVKYKGVVTKIDTNARSGSLSLSKSRRFTFYFKKDLPIEEFDLLVISLHKKVKIYLSGQVEMDYESNPRRMDIALVEMDSDLFRT